MQAGTRTFRYIRGNYPDGGYGKCKEATDRSSKPTQNSNGYADTIMIPEGTGGAQTPAERSATPQQVKSLQRPMMASTRASQSPQGGRESQLKVEYDFADILRDSPGAEPTQVP